jgi:hypothetical protein
MAKSQKKRTALKRQIAKSLFVESHQLSFQIGGGYSSPMPECPDAYTIAFNKWLSSRSNNS